MFWPAIRFGFSGKRPLTTTAAGGFDRKCQGSDQENQTMADNVRMAPSPERKRGREGDRFVPARPRGREGALSPAGVERACERSRPRSGLDGERGRGRLPGWEAVPRHRQALELVDENGHRVVALRVDQDTKEENQRRWPTP